LSCGATHALRRCSLKPGLIESLREPLELLDRLGAQGAEAEDADDSAQSNSTTSTTSAASAVSGDLPEYVLAIDDAQMPGPTAHPTAQAVQLT